MSGEQHTQGTIEGVQDTESLPVSKSQTNVNTPTDVSDVNDVQPTSQLTNENDQDSKTDRIERMSQRERVVKAAPQSVKKSKQKVKMVVKQSKDQARPDLQPAKTKPVSVSKKKSTREITSPRPVDSPIPAQSPLLKTAHKAATRSSKKRANEPQIARLPNCESLKDETLCISIQDQLAPRMSSAERIVDTQKVIRPSRNKSRTRYESPHSPMQVQRLKNDGDEAPTVFEKISVPAKPAIVPTSKRWEKRQSIRLERTKPLGIASDTIGPAYDIGTLKTTSKTHNQVHPQRALSKNPYQEKTTRSSRSITQSTTSTTHTNSRHSMHDSPDKG